MPALHIFVADDQIPPSNVPEREFRKSILAKHGDTPQNRSFLKLIFNTCGSILSVFFL